MELEAPAPRSYGCTRLFSSLFCRHVSSSPGDGSHFNELFASVVWWSWSWGWSLRWGRRR